MTRERIKYEIAGLCHNDEAANEAVNRICVLFSVSNNENDSEEAVCLEHDWKGDSFDHFGFCLEEVCENCGEKRQTGC
jgi:hypothetical protein